MIYRGKLKGGVVVLDEQVDLPDGTEVRVEPVLEQQPQQRPKTLAERFAKSIGAAPDLPVDMAAQHDHYLHGMPKR